MISDNIIRLKPMIIACIEEDEDRIAINLYDLLTKSRGRHGVFNKRNNTYEKFDTAFGNFCYQANISDAVAAELDTKIGQLIADHSTNGGCDG